MFGFLLLVIIRERMDLVNILRRVFNSFCDRVDVDFSLLISRGEKIFF